VRESGGRFGLACLFEADNARTMLQHAESCGLPATEVRPVARWQVVRPFAPTMVYLIRRRRVWRTESELELALETFQRLGDGDLARRLSWLRTYAVHENDGSLGSVCLFQSVDPSALGEHAVRAGVRADEITPVIGRIVYRQGLGQQREVTPALA
jgi:hypothetical protein